MEVNGRFYNLWGQFVENKERWIGGKLHDKETLCGPCPVTTITDVELLPNGDDSAFFWIRGKDYDCGFDVKYGGVNGDKVENGLMLGGQMGTFSIQEKEVEGE